MDKLEYFCRFQSQRKLAGIGELDGIEHPIPILGTWELLCVQFERVRRFGVRMHTEFNIQESSAGPEAVVCQ